MPKTYTQLCEDIGYTGLSFPSVAPIGAAHAVDDVDNAAYDLTDAENLQKLNAYVGDLGNVSAMNPYYPINALWRRLLSAGINFNLNAVSITGDYGVQALPITQFGGRIGFLGNDAVYREDDGTRVPGGLSIVFRWSTFDGKYTVTAQIRPTGEALTTESAPANNVGDGAIAGKDAPLGRKKKIKVLRRKPPVQIINANPAV